MSRSHLQGNQQTTKHNIANPKRRPLFLHTPSAAAAAAPPPPTAQQRNLSIEAQMAMDDNGLGPGLGLGPRLAPVLPRGHRFGVHHLSTPPHRVDALCSPPPGERPDRTYCEKHFLAVSIDAPSPGHAAASGPEASASASATPRPVLVLGLEVFIYTTAHSTTLFVSKADSTGHLSLLNLPRGTPSPIREICAAFVAHLVAARRRPHIQFVVSLFARAQAQYLFPGSVECPTKHVLDDRGLVRWWCRVLDPLLRSPSLVDTDTSAKGHLVVPGLDDYETRAFIPRASLPSWSLGHPLEHISHYHREFDWLPPRCLIPRFPDDPKSRFRDELDDEAAKTRGMRTTGSWRSVRTLDTFWEMMAFRQECSSGRLTGFIWLVFDDRDKKPTASGQQTAGTSDEQLAPQTPKKQHHTSNTTPSTTPRKLFPKAAPPTSPTSSAKAAISKNKTTTTPSTTRKHKNTKHNKKKKKLRGPIIPRQPRIKTALRNYLLDRPVSTPYYHWPPRGRGARIVGEDAYKRIVDLLLHLDFATLDKAASSTARWVREVGAGGPVWGYHVLGERDMPSGADGPAAAAQQVNNLSGLVKRKRSDTAPGDGAAPTVNVLSAGLVKKKPKEQVPDTPEVNVLSAGLVRKKPKT